MKNQRAQAGETAKTKPPQAEGARGRKNQRAQVGQAGQATGARAGEGERYFTPEQLHRWAREDVLRLLLASLRQVEQLQARSAELQALRQRVAALEAAQREAKRQAALFRVPEARRVQRPKRPGRPAGHPGAFRPRPAQIDEEITVELSRCAHCGGAQWRELVECEQFLEDLPVARPHVTRLRTYQAICAGCGAPAVSTHPRQVSRATGAAGTHLGPRALALATDLSKRQHLPLRRVCAVLHEHWGLKLTAGGLSQALGRVGQRLEPRYHQLHQEICAAPVVHVDETGWWAGGACAWLWVFATPRATFYYLCRSRGREVLQAVLGFAWPGVLVSDCLQVYDVEGAPQQKCYSHHLRAIGEGLAAAPAAAQQPGAFLPAAQALLQRALEVRKLRDLPDAAVFAAERRALDQAAEALFGLPHAEPAEAAVYYRLQQQRDHLFSFLDHPGVEATNNLAERQLRPAVIARKLSGGHKTAAGMQTFHILASLAATCTQTQTSFLECVAQAVVLDSS